MRLTPEFLHAAADAFGTELPICVEIAATLRDLGETGTVTFETCTVPALDGLADMLAAADAHPLARRLDPQAALALPWNEGPAAGAAWVELVGPQAPWRSTRNRFGLYLQSANVFYAHHWHAAEEIYFLLSGATLWEVGNSGYCWRRPGDAVRHAPMESHSMQTRGQPFLGLWAWSGELGFESFTLDADGTPPSAHDDPPGREPAREAPAVAACGRMRANAPTVTRPAARLPGAGRGRQT